MQVLHLPSRLGLRPLRFANWNEDMAFTFPHLVHILLPLASNANRLAVRCAEVLRCIAWHDLHLALRPHLPCGYLLNRDSGRAVRQPRHSLVRLAIQHSFFAVVAEPHNHYP